MPGATSGVRDLEVAMDALLARCSERAVFLHPVWLRTWLSEFGEGCEPLFIETTSDEAADDDLLAVAPLMRTDDRLTFIGDSSICDFMDFLIAPERSGEAYAALWGRLAAEEWQELDLWGLKEGSQTREEIGARARAAGFDVVEEREAVAPRLALPATWEDYLASLNKKDRHELRRKLRRLLDSGANVELSVLAEQSEVVGAMDAFLELHVGSRQDKTDFMTPEMASFFRRMASAMSGQGLIRLFMLRVDGRAVAAVLCFDAGSQLYMYNSGYDPEYASLSVGLVSKALCLRWAIENGKEGLDFLRGDEPYKYDMGAKDQQIYRLIVRRQA